MASINEKLDQPETIFFHLLDDEKMFAHTKFLKALQQQKARKVEDHLKALGIHGISQKKLKGKGRQETSQLARVRSGTVKPMASNAQSQTNLGQVNLEATNSATASKMPHEAEKKSKQEKEEEAMKKREDGEKKRLKQLDVIDVYGIQYQGTKQVEDYSFFNDLNYGDMAIVFENPFYDFQLKERKEIELHQFNHLNLLGHKTMGMLNISPKKTKKMEKEKEEQTKKINDKFKKLIEDDSKRNVRVDLEQAYDFYSKYINLKPENQIESRKDEIHQKQAFANALIFFSDRYYVNDMGKIKHDQQPYSDACTQSLRDYLVDTMFEFSLFHKISKRTFYTEKENDQEKINAFKPGIDEAEQKRILQNVVGRSRIGLKNGEELNSNPLGEIIKSKPMRLQNAIERSLSKSQEGSAFKQVLNEETNYFFIKRPDEIPHTMREQEFGGDDPKKIARDQYKEYIKMTKSLYETTLEFYNRNINTEANANGRPNEQPGLPSFGGAQQSSTRATDMLKGRLGFNKQKKSSNRLSMKFKRSAVWIEGNLKS